MLNRSPLRVAVLSSRRAPGLAHLLTRAPRRGRAWDIVCCLTSEETFADEDVVAAHGVILIHHPLRNFYRGLDPQARLGDLTLRPDYDRRTAHLLAPSQPDVVLLAGYLLVMTRPMLAAYPNRILNVHHSDLLLRDGAGTPRYPGLRAVRDAILAGETETRSTVHVVTEGLDQGPPLLRSEAFPVPRVAQWARAAGAADVLKSVIWAQQEWMLRDAFGVLMERALDVLAGVDSQAALAHVSLEPLS